jgi:hypothetical protein
VESTAASQPGLHQTFASPYHADDHTGASKGWRLGALLLLGPCRCERTAVAHVVPGGLDSAVRALDVRDAELVDVAVEGFGDAAHVGAQGDRDRYRPGDRARQKNLN